LDYLICKDLIIKHELEIVIKLSPVKAQSRVAGTGVMKSKIKYLVFIPPEKRRDCAR